MKRKPTISLDRLVQIRNSAFTIHRDNLQLLKEEAIRAQHPDAYVIACDALGEEFDNPELARKSTIYRNVEDVIEGRSDVQPLTSRTAYQNILSQLTAKKIPANFGLFKWSSFGKMHPETARTVWYGMNNLDIPETMLAAMDGKGILSKYWAGGTKQHGVEDDPKEFYALCDKINSYATPAMNRSVHLDVGPRVTSYHYFKALEPEMLRLVPKEDQERFLESYFTPHIPSKREDSWHGAEYDMPGGHSKKIYADNGWIKVRNDFARVIDEMKSNGVKNKALLK
jgi:hypothetical protein